MLDSEILQLSSGIILTKLFPFLPIRIHDILYIYTFILFTNCILLLLS